MTSILIMALCTGTMVLSQYWFREVFFKRPMGKVSPPPGCLGSPVDGTLVYVRRVAPGPIYGEKLGEKHFSGEIDYPAIHVGIYMSIFDRHHVMAPCSCTVVRIQKWSAGVNLPMLDLHEYVRVMFFRKFEEWFSRHLRTWISQNERVTLDLLDDRGNPFKMILIGDKYVNKIDLEVSEGTTLEAGQKIAFISRGSQTDLLFKEGVILPENSRAKVGDRVTAGDLLFPLESSC